MATMKEKWSEFVAMLGGDEAMARSVVKQAQDTEAQADQSGLKFKEEKAAAFEAMTEVFKAAKDDKKKPAADESETPEEAAAETPADEEAEATDKMPENFKKKMAPAKKEAEADYAVLAAGLAPHIHKMIDEKMSSTTAKEQATDARIVMLEAKLKEAQDTIATLTADQPRGFFSGFRPSQSGGTLLRNASGEPIALKDQQTDPFDSVIDQLIKGSQMQFMPPTQAAPKA